MPARHGTAPAGPSLRQRRQLVPLGTLATAASSPAYRLSALSAVLDAAPSAGALLMGRARGIYADDQQARALLTAARA